MSLDHQIHKGCFLGDKKKYLVLNQFWHLRGFCGGVAFEEC